MLFDSAIVLAGGKSRRMGFDKAFMKIGDTTCIEFIIKELKKHFGEVIIAASGENQRFKFLDAKTVVDEFKDTGPIAGLHAGLKTSNSLYNYLIACDMPVISDELISLMKQCLARDPDIVACRRGHFIEPFHAVYSKKLIARIEDQIKSNHCSIFSLMKNLNLHLIDDRMISKKCKALPIWTNLNTQDELENFRGRKHHGIKNL